MARTLFLLLVAWVGCGWWLLQPPAYQVLDPELAKQVRGGQIGGGGSQLCVKDNYRWVCNAEEVYCSTVQDWAEDLDSPYLATRKRIKKYCDPNIAWEPCAYYRGQDNNFCNK